MFSRELLDPIRTSRSAFRGLGNRNPVRFRTIDCAAAAEIHDMGALPTIPYGADELEERDDVQCGVLCLVIVRIDRRISVGKIIDYVEIGYESHASFA